MHATRSNAPEGKAFTRRDALHLFTRGALGASLLGLLHAVGRYLGHGSQGAPSPRRVLGPLEAFPRGSSTLLQEAGVLLERDATGAFRALSLVCTHLGCRLRQEGDALLCPCHGSRFDQDGRAKHGPAVRPLRDLWLEVDGEGQLVVDLSRPAPPGGRWVPEPPEEARP
jgi:Rieske Fe-S protein